MRITTLAGGVGGARFLRGLLHAFPAADVTVIGNTGDDITLHGVRICPDLDTVMYTLGGGIHEEQGWGRAAETFQVQDELSAYGEGPAWFGLGDRDIATHLIRTRLLREGASLSEVTRGLCERWRPGVRLLPMSDDPVETHVDTDDATLHFQEWWIRLHAEPAVRRFDFVGAPTAQPAPGVIAALEQADVIVLPPSNPVVSIGAILAVPGIAAALRTANVPVVGVSPIIGTAPVRGMADACLRAIGVDTTAYAVARHYGPRSEGGLLDGWLVDESDKDAADRLDEEGLAARAVPLWMHDVETTAAIATEALQLAEDVRR
ncbi:MAG: 2-phospho-L-lactate transferase [Actinomycetes bacterium]